MPKVTKKTNKRKHKTNAEVHYDREMSKQKRIDAEVRFQRRTGLCPMCRQRPSAKGITCGSMRCIEQWLIPKSQSRIQIIVETVESFTDYQQREKRMQQRQQRRVHTPGGKNDESSPPSPKRKKPSRSFVVLRQLALAGVDEKPWDEARALILEYYEQTGTPLPPTDDALRLAIHQERVSLGVVYPQLAEKSKKWLAAQGYGG